MADCAACAGQVILQWTGQLVLPHLRYYCCYKCNIEELKKEVTQLKVEQGDQQIKIEEAKRNGHKILPGVQRWMEEVDKIKGEAERIWESKAGCLNLKSRYRLGKRAKRMTEKVARVRGNRNFPDVSYIEPPKRISDGESNEGFVSRTSYVDQIMEALKDANVKKIGLSGPGGVGKSTIARQVEKRFGNAIMVEVKADPDINKIQQQIADLLGMKELEPTEDARARRLHERLKQENDMRLIIFDDLWKPLDLRKQIGIPLGVDSKIKVLLTSRDYDLLSGQMRCQVSFKVDVLSDSEAWELFTKEIELLPNDPDIHPVAEKIVGRCGGLPLLIVTMATTLRTKDLNGWKHALHQLEHPSHQGDIPELNVAYSVLKVSYDNLPNRKTKRFFLLCAILSHDPRVIDLFMYSVGLGFLQHQNTIEDALVDINALISQLKHSNLLLDSPSNLRFAIHDVFRDVALSIASSEEDALVVRDMERLKNGTWWNKKKLAKYRYMCLENCDIGDLPQEQLSCPNLEFFLLDGKNSDLKTIPSTFFQSMNELQVIRFTDMHFPSIPSSLALLKELRSLCLHSCVLGDIAEVGNLKSLTVLSLAHSTIRRLPSELSQLTFLQMLNLANCSKLEVIPAKLLSSLKRLEVLNMGDSFTQWEAEGFNPGNGNASLDELKHLTNLSSLTVQIPDASVLPENLFKDIPLERYEIVIGREYYWWESNEYRTTLNINGIHLDDGIRKLFENVEVLNLEDVLGNTKVLCDLHGREFLKLKRLNIRKSYQFDYVICNSTGSVASFSELVEIVIQDCKSMEAFVVSTQQNSVSNEVIVFHQLHTLKMSDLPKLLTFYLEENATNNNECNKESKSLFDSKVSFPKLERMELQSLNSSSIWDDQLPQNSFSNLKTLIVKNCGFVERLIPFHVLKSLSNLEELVVCDCKSLEMVFDFEELNNQEIQLLWAVPLRKLRLKKLPKLKHVWSNHSQEMEFFHEKVVQNLKELKLDGEFAMMIWNAQFLPVNLFQSVEELSLELDGSVSFAHGLHNNRFPNLQKLELSGSVKEEVIPTHLLNERPQQPQNLQTLFVWDCHELINLGPSFLSFANLTDIQVSSCFRLSSLMTPSTSRSLVQLTRLEITWCKEIEEIIRKQEGEEEDDVENEIVFQKLESLRLERLPRLRSFCSHNYTFKFPSLEEVIIDDCERMSMMFCAGDIHTPSLEGVQYGSEYEKLVDNNLNTTIQHLVSSQSQLKFSGCWVKELMPHLVDVAPFTTLVLKDVKCLKHIWNQHSQKNSLLQNIQTLQVSFCRDLIYLGPSFLSFANLTHIQVSGCFRLSSLMTPSTSRGLVQLTRLEITWCNEIEEIIRKQEGEEEDDVENEIVFQKLESLRLERLPRLRSFCSHNYTFKFPSLEQVIIKDCERMSMMFCAGDIHTPSLEAVQYGSKWYERAKYEKLVDNNLNTTIQQLFLAKVKKLELHPEMRNIWMEKVSHHMPFSRLEDLIVDNCDFLSEYVIPTHLIRFLSKLKVLEVRNCHAIKTIFDLKGTDLDGETHNLLANIRLKKLELHNLPNLKCVWTQDHLEGSNCFQNLEGLYVSECESLRNIFVASIAKGLGQLMELSIVSCGVEEIIAKDETSKESPNFVFPQLSYLKLDKLSNLKCFYPERCTFEWPQLTTLFVSQCENLNVFGTKMTSITESDREDEVPPLFLAEKVIPNLESLSLSQKDIVTFERNGQFQAELFHEVKYLCLESFVGESIAFPYDFLAIGRFPNLNELHVNHSSFEEIFPSQVQHVDDLGEIAPFKILYLANLDQLKSIWNDDNVDSQLPSIAQNLERLIVECCCSLINLTPSSASLENLRELEVSGCHQLTYLVTTSTAKSLVNLWRLKITDCEKMEEIITNENNDAEGEIKFNELEQVELTSLPILKSFCSENQSFRFPDLEYLTIKGCHQMKMFCHGVLETPRLGGLETEEGRTPLEGDLNKTIELLISDKDG